MRRDFFLKASIAFVLLATLITPSVRELYVGDETKYAQIVREMRAGALFLPTLQGAPFTHKPPVHFWLMTLLTHLFGVDSIWPYVLPSLVAFALLLWVVRREGGAVAALVCGTTLMVWISAQSARMDVLFTLLLTVGALMVRRFFDAHDQRALLLGSVAFGLAAMVKGPMAPVIAISLWLFESIRRRRRPRPLDALGLAVMIAIPLLWLLPAAVLADPAFLHEVLFKQTLGRAVGAWIHREPPWFYFMRLPAEVCPWFLLLVLGSVAAFKRCDETAKFHVSWILAVLVPYSLVSSKLDVYMMPLIPAMALLIGRLLDVEDGWTRWAHRSNILGLVLTVLLGGAGAAVSARYVAMLDPALAASRLVQILFLILAASALLALVLALRRRDALSSTLLFALMQFGPLLYTATFLVPVANELASTAPLIRTLSALDVPPERIALYASPHLWIRDMPPAFARVRYAEAVDLRTLDPAVIVTSRAHAGEITEVLSGYSRVREVRMIGKWFDVYSRKASSTSRLP
jgi:4-amino-4-deoxy-L-arabinose transferase-like glycosyltransferase